MSAAQLPGGGVARAPFLRVDLTQKILLLCPFLSSRKSLRKSNSVGRLLACHAIGRGFKSGLFPATFKVYRAITLRHSLRSRGSEEEPNMDFEPMITVF